MLETIKGLLKEVDLFTPKSEKELEGFRLNFLGKKGKMNALFDAFRISQIRIKKKLAKQ